MASGVSVLGAHFAVTELLVPTTEVAATDGTAPPSTSRPNSTLSASRLLPVMVSVHSMLAQSVLGVTMVMVGGGGGPQAAPTVREITSAARKEGSRWRLGMAGLRTTPRRDTARSAKSDHGAT